MPKPLTFPFYHQLDAMDCGPACLRMISRYYGKSYSIQFLREKSFITREGVSLLGISDAAELIGFKTVGVRLSFEQLKTEATLPCIAHWGQNHFIVIYKIKKNKVFVADPAHGHITYTVQEFLKGWASAENQEGIALLLETTPEFYQRDDEAKKRPGGFKFLFPYLSAYKKHLGQLALGLLLGSLLELVFPFLTQAIVDFGISNQDLGFIYVILLAQLMLYFSRASVDLIRGWILLHIGTRMNISIISDFLIKLMKLPLPFFDSKLIGDLLQRIGDHRRIELFLTSATLGTLFSLFSLAIFSIVLGIYSLKILAVFLLGSLLSTVWVTVFLRRRSELDYKRFRELSRNQSNLIELITGMPEIKLNNCEKQKRWQWEHIQARLFKINVRSLSLNQAQQAGSMIITEIKNIVITFLSANEVIHGRMTLGMMLAVSYIIGQMNRPIDQMIGLLQTAQDARISLERLSEIHNRPEEEETERETTAILPEKRNITVRDLSFRYEGPESEMVLKGLTLDIPHNKITAIVGMSGSGKTTLIKLLLKFYKVSGGEIRLGDIRLDSVNTKLWRQRCGVVMQDGFIFSDTIASNIALSDEAVDKAKLLAAVRMANIQEYIESLPLGYNSKIGMEGHGLSQGQRQRILIARAVYKDPEFLFFDEATNALDANNELVIMRNLEAFLKGRTAVIVAHRLSTVKRADQIVVLDKGRIAELGTHAELVAAKGAYFNLIKNQLELDS